MSYSFKEQQEFSNSGNECWQEIYKLAFRFPHSLEEVKNTDPRRLQGTNRVIKFDAGYELLIDEKRRRYSPDKIFLEFISHSEKHTPGWLERPVVSDYFAFAYAAHGVCYLFPANDLQAAWHKNRDKWLEEYKTTYCSNPGHYSLGCLVPIEVLAASVPAMIRVNWELEQ